MVVVEEVSEFEALCLVVLHFVVLVQLVVQVSLEPSWVLSLGKDHRYFELLDLLAVDEALPLVVVVLAHP